MSQQQISSAFTNLTSSSLDEQVNHFNTLSHEQKLSTLYREILGQRSELNEFKARFKHFADSVDNLDDRVTSLELRRPEDQVRFEDQIASTQQALVYTQQQKLLAEVIIGITYCNDAN